MFPWSSFPFNKDMKNMMKQMKPDEVNKYVQSIMDQMMPQQMQGMMNPQNIMPGFNNGNGQSQKLNSLPSSVFETHDDVFVRIPIKNEQWLKDMRIYHTSNQIIIEHIPEHEDKHTIILPALVRKKGATALYKDGTLELKIPKNIDMQYSEIDVTETL
ncbi:Hsp20/alpha crystallin family protein [Bacillus sp. DTU_2020_1000418_1_SI_GHA_SEK_038]|uniref:Hsp20/alpha crystallin family protein n=1 Tax=Bacillus sp. DTU_2020_1000418_1_SI_GHA_SEK_038 TaxID=3077585 RepID=UPI0028ECC329|nr:Hsp20/alpha crystallin family protein [Bacillus sp. DTU_2020_1000418_1_SI_GHA_SEK_038]WNS73867.1 Hsp20/alpha crystallin family protein [Bacillus sp. DTU_2020_1000418_1_SI_GHA_SEK_038]